MRNWFVSAIFLLVGASSFAANTYPTPPLPYQVLDTTKIIAVKIGEAVTTTAPTYAVAFMDSQETVWTPGNAFGSFTVTYASAVAAPAAGNRNISSITVCNIDTISHTFFVNVAPTGVPATISAGLLNTYTLAAGASASLTVSGILSSTPLTLPLPTLSGGTGSALTPVIGDLLSAASTTTFTRLADVAAGSYLRSGGVGIAPLWSTPTLPNAAGTALKVLRSDGTNFITSTSTFSDTPSTALKWLRSDGTNWITSTSTLSDTPSTAGKVVVSDGTNWITSTPTFPNASATALKHIRSDGTNWIASTATISDTPSTALKWLRSDGTNWITSTATLAEGAVTSGKVLISDGTNWTASTPTYPNAAPGAGTFPRGDGTNWVTSTTTIPNTFVGGSTMVTTSTSAMTESIGYRAVAHAASPYTVVAADCQAILAADPTAGTVAINLPALASTNTGYRLTVINIIGAGAGATTVVPNGTDKIDGTNVTHTLNAQYSKMTLRSSGAAAGWYVESAEDYLVVSNAGTGAAWTATTAQYGDVGGGSIALTPGEWDFSGTIVIQGGTFTAAIIGVAGTTTGNSSAGLLLGDNNMSDQAATTNSGNHISGVKVSVVANTTYYLKANITYTVAPTVYGRMSARRVR